MFRKTTVIKPQYIRKTTEKKSAKEGLKVKDIEIIPITRKDKILNTAKKYFLEILDNLPVIYWDEVADNVSAIVRFTAGHVADFTVGVCIGFGQVLVFVCSEVVPVVLTGLWSVVRFGFKLVLFFITDVIGEIFMSFFNSGGSGLSNIKDNTGSCSSIKNNININNYGKINIK